MKVLVTGGAGFLGSHVCEYYRNRGDQVVAYDNLTKHELLRTGYHAGGARDYMVDFLKGLGVELIVDDVRHKHKLRGAAWGCDYIIHCAAQPAMTISLERPEFDADVNVMGAINVLETARVYKVPVALCSTIHVYGNGLNKYLSSGDDESGVGFLAPTPEIDEEWDILSGRLTPLHASKRAMEIYTRMYTESFGVEAAIFRLTGMYGPRQFGGEDHGWVANFAIRTIMGLPINVISINGDELAGHHAAGQEIPGTRQGRDIIYVTDAVDAFVKWFEQGRPSGLYNIGGGDITLTTLGQCLDALGKISGLEQDVHFLPPRFGDLYYFACDYRKALAAFGWEPKTSVEIGLLMLLNWITENKNLFKGG